MTARDLTPHLFAAGSALGGLGFVMTRPSPSMDEIAIGLSCAALSAGFSAMQFALAPRRDPAARPPPPRQPQEELAPEGSAPRAMLTNTFLPAPSARETSVKLSEAPTHRQRNGDRQLLRG